MMLTVAPVTGPADSPLRVCETKGVLNKEPRPTPTRKCWGMRGADGYRAPTVPPEGHPATFPTQPGEKNRAPAETCGGPSKHVQGLFGCTIFPAQDIVGICQRRTDQQSLCRKPGLREGKPYARSNTESQRLFPCHPLHPATQVPPLPDQLCSCLEASC